MKRLLIAAIVFFLPFWVWAGEIGGGYFSETGLEGWEEKEFAGRTVYSLINDGGRTVLKAEADDSASGLGYEFEADLNDYPILRWSWKIEGVVKGADPRKKETDDSVARVYVVFPNVLFWKTTSINYVWASNFPKGESLMSPYAPKNVVIVAVESGDEKSGRWVFEERNVLEDYRRLFGEDPPEFGGFGLMTDTDNTGGRVVAYYGDIKLMTE